MLKPENHVTRGMKERLAGPISPRTGTPRIPEALIEWLEGQYGPRCYNPQVENLEAHLLYAGEVRLIQRLRMIADQQFLDNAAMASLADDDTPLPDGAAELILPREKE